jgi:hypothetical protein
MAGGTQFNRERFDELVLLFSARSESDPRMSRVKLNKLLYRADFEAFRRFGHSLTGATYIRGEHGPMASELPAAETRLGGKGYLAWKHEAAGPHIQKIPEARVQPEPALFSPDELEVIDSALHELREHGGKGAREWSHRESAGWNLVDDGKAIPYETAYVSTKRPDQSLFQRAKRLAQERNWAKVRP